MAEPKTYVLIGPNGAPYECQTPGSLGGNRRSKIYGRLDCRTALDAIARGGYVNQRVFLKDESTARIAGYRPCAVCLPEEYAIWKEGNVGLPSRTAASGRQMRDRGRRARAGRLD